MHCRYERKIRVERKNHMISFLDVKIVSKNSFGGNACVENVNFDMTIVSE